MSNGKLGDYGLTARTAEAIRNIVRQTINSERPKDTLAVVQSVDQTNKVATVIIHGETDPVTLPYTASSAPSSPGDLVKISNKPGDVRIKSLQQSSVAPSGLVDQPYLYMPRVVRKGIYSDSMFVVAGAYKSFSDDISTNLFKSLGCFVFPGDGVDGRIGSFDFLINIRYQGQNFAKCTVSWKFHFVSMSWGDFSNSTDWFIIQPHEISHPGNYYGNGLVLEAKVIKAGSIYSSRTEVYFRVRSNGSNANSITYEGEVITSGQIVEDTSYVPPSNYTFTNPGGSEAPATQYEFIVSGLDSDGWTTGLNAVVPTSPHTQNTNVTSYAKLKNGVVSFGYSFTLGAAITVTAATGNAADTVVGRVTELFRPYGCPHVQSLSASTSDRMVSGYVNTNGNIGLSITVPNTTLPSGTNIDLKGTYLI